MDEREALKQQLGLTDAELDVYIRTGNLPVRRGRRGAGVLKIEHGGSRHAPTRPRDPRPKPKGDVPVRKISSRAEIVRRVMKERGVKLGEASRIVKQEGLY
jgi:hypothetical protein